MENQYIKLDNDQSSNQSSLQYYDANDAEIDESTISENYVTTIGDNDTIYLSVEENSETLEVTLEDLQNLTIENEVAPSIMPNLSDQELPNTDPLKEFAVGEEGSNVVVYIPKDSNKLYGIQMARDEHGNIQKYKFQLRANENGELEVMEETLCLLSNAESESQKINNSCVTDENNVQAKIDNGVSEEGYRFVENSTTLIDSYIPYSDETNVNTSGSLKSEEIIAGTDNIKQELSSFNNYNDITSNINTKENIENTGEFENGQFEMPFPTETKFLPEPAITILKKDMHTDTEPAESNHDNLVRELLFENKQIEIQYETEQELQESDTQPQLSENEEEANLDEIDNEEIMLDSPLEPKCVFEEYEVEAARCHRGSRILRDSNIPKANSKSTKSVSEHWNKSDDLPNLEIFEKRFAKNKDAMQAKKFHQFLNRTTISYAPKRQQKQPRKQEINPVSERKDEEIIVQEVMISSSGVIEGLDALNKDSTLRITATVELSDSEEENGRAENRQPSKRNIRTLLSPVLSDCDGDIIEICSDEDFAQSECNERQIKVKTIKGKTDNLSVALKRKRGRPPKRTKASANSVTTESNKFVWTRNSDTECSKNQSENCDSTSNSYTARSNEINCPHCPKTFASQNSLNTHIIHHNLENSLKNKAKMANHKSNLPKFDYTHKCDQCGETYKNAILLKRHNCAHKKKVFSCSVCLKAFRDIALLNIHKKSHAKSNLVKNTSVFKVTPKKVISGIGSKSATPKQSLKCTECPRVCDSEKKLAIHLKTHKKFVCCSCSLTFSSKLLLDAHVRTNCVKFKAPSNKRLSFSVRKSFVHTPPRLSSVKGTYKSENARLNQSVVTVRHDCNNCSKKFSTFRSLYTHKLQEHGLSVPDKSLMNNRKATNYKPIAAHSGIPTNERLKRAFAGLRKKLSETENLPV